MHCAYVSRIATDLRPTCIIPYKYARSASDPQGRHMIGPLGPITVDPLGVNRPTVRVRTVGGSGQSPDPPDSTPWGSNPDPPPGPPPGGGGRGGGPAGPGGPVYKFAFLSNPEKGPKNGSGFQKTWQNHGFWPKLVGDPPGPPPRGVRGGPRGGPPPERSPGGVFRRASSGRTGRGPPPKGGSPGRFLAKILEKTLGHSRAKARIRAILGPQK